MTDEELNKFVWHLYKAKYTPAEAYAILESKGITREQLKRIVDMPEPKDEDKWI